MLFLVAVSEELVLGLGRGNVDDCQGKWMQQWKGEGVWRGLWVVQAHCSRAADHVAANAAVTPNNLRFYYSAVRSFTPINAHFSAVNNLISFIRSDDIAAGRNSSSRDRTAMATE